MGFPQVCRLLYSCLEMIRLGQRNWDLYFLWWLRWIGTAAISVVERPKSVWVSCAAVIGRKKRFVSEEEGIQRCI